MNRLELAVAIALMSVGCISRPKLTLDDALRDVWRHLLTVNHNICLAADFGVASVRSAQPVNPWPDPGCDWPLNQDGSLKPDHR